MRSALVILAVSLFGCGGGASDPDFGDADPRCVSACTDVPPAIDGAGDVCNTASRAACIDECEARIAGVMTVCASCLLEETCFDPEGCDDRPSDPITCDPNGCTITGRNGSCTFPQGDEEAAADCERQVNPRREVACTAEFRPTTECSTECAN